MEASLSRSRAIYPAIQLQMMAIVQAVVQEMYALQVVKDVPISNGSPPIALQNAKRVSSIHTIMLH